MSITIDAIFDGEVLRPQQPVSLVPDQHYLITIEEPSDKDTKEDAWSVLESLTGTYDGPADWSAEHDHYLFGAPKRKEQDV